MKKVLWVLILLLIPAFSHAEISTNLRIEKVMVPGNSRLVQSMTYVDDDGHPVIATDKGYATVRYSYAASNLVGKEEYLDENGEPVNCVDGYASITHRYYNGKPSETCYFDTEGKPVAGPEGFARQVIAYEGRRHISTWNYGPDGNPVGLHRITEYDKRGSKPLITSDSWYNTDEQPAPGEDGYARAEYEYSGNNLIRKAFLNADGSPYFSSKDGYATMVSEYTGSKVRSTSYFGKENELIAGPEGYAYILYTYKQGYTNEMYYNADGSLYINQKGICGMSSKYGTRDRLIDQYYFIGEGIRGKSSDGYSRTKIAYNYRGKTTIQSYFDENDKLMIVEKLGYARVEYEYSMAAYLVKKSFYDTNKKLIRSNEGYAVQKNTYYNRKMIETSFYAEDGKTKINGPDGYATVKYEHEKTKISNEKYFDPEGNPFYVEGLFNEKRLTWDDSLQTGESYWRDGEKTNREGGYHEELREYYGTGKISRKSYYNVDGEPTMYFGRYAVQETEYNSNGGVMSEKYYDTDGQLVNTPEKEYAYIKTIPYSDAYEAVFTDEEDEKPENPDDEDMPEEQDNPEDEPFFSKEIVEYHGLDDMLMTVSGGYAYTIREKNAQGQVIYEQYYSIDGKQATNAYGYAAARRSYDRNGAVAEESYYNEADEPVVCQAGYHRVVRTWLDRNHVASEAWFDTEGTPISLYGNTYVKVEREYDEAGNAAVERYCDAEGKKIACSGGYDEVHREFNEQRQMIRFAYYLEGKPYYMPAGYCVMRRSYDENDAVAEESYYNENDEPVMITSGYHRVVKTWLDKDHVASEAWFDTEGNPVTTNNTYVMIAYEYDENGNPAVERYYDADGEQIACYDGYDEVHREFNDRKQITRYAYYLNGAPFYVPSGYCAMRRGYDENGAVTEESYYNEADEPVMCQAGYHRVERTWIDRSHVGSEAWFDTEGKPISLYGNTYVKVEREYDEAGNVAVERYCDAEGKKIACSGGYDEVRREFNEQRQIIRFAYYLEGKPYNLPAGFCVMRRSYDENGTVAEESYYNEDDEPVTAQAGYHKIVRTWAGMLVTSEAWFDTAGKPVAVNNTYVKVEHEYDEAGALIAERYYDPDGRMIPCAGGYDEIRWEEGQAVYYLNGEVYTKEEEKTEDE